MNNDDIHKMDMSMKKLVSIVAVLVSAFTTIIAQVGCLPVNLTVKVLDDENQPVSQADVEIIFSDVRAKGFGKGWGNEAKYDKRKGITDANGMFSASGATNYDISVGAEKASYYKSSGGISFYEGGKGKAGDNALVLTLRKKLNPVPMYAKKVNSVWGISKIPVLNQDVGYDLEVGDWVAPHGKGKTADFVFNVVAESKDPKKDRKCVYSIKFSNANDGIQEYSADNGDQSAYRWPYEAPEDGYTTTLEKYNIVTSDRREKNIKNDNEMNYIYRVRTKTDEKGNIIEARYGKIQGEITVFSDSGIQFIYYFNPSGNRSLEFDTEKNLFIPAGARKNDKKYYNFTGFEP